jgi:uracil-DNA glycosylase
MKPHSIDAFVAMLAAGRAGPNSMNPFDRSRDDNEIRRQNLARYLGQLSERRPTTLLVGEAPGYRGMAITGVPFTNTVLLQRGITEFGLFGADNGYSVPDTPAVAAEPTATVMWQVLTSLEFLPVLWSAFPLHPHRPGEPLSNRTPTVAETMAWSWSWQALADIMAINAIVAVGNVAQASLTRSGMTVPRVRHPAHGGREEFRQGLQTLLAEGTIS